MYKLEMSKNKSTKRELNEALYSGQAVDVQLQAGSLCWLHRP